MTRTQENIDAANRYHAYLAGWTHADVRGYAYELIHHRNEVKTDNRLENIEVESSMRIRLTPNE